jgi:uncharacterized membrane-anchored protein
MITKFDTGAGAGAGAAATGKSDNTLLYVLIGGVAIFCLYKFVYVPYMEKKKAEQGN